MIGLFSFGIPFEGFFFGLCNADALLTMETIISIAPFPSAPESVTPSISSKMRQFGFFSPKTLCIVVEELMRERNRSLDRSSLLIFFSQVSKAAPLYPLTLSCFLSLSLSLCDGRG